MDVKCPNCGKGIHLVGAKELKEEFGLGPNSVAHARDRGRFPEPFLSFANRNLYLREEVEEYVESRSRERVKSHISDLLTVIARLPEAEQAAARRELEKQVLRPEPTSGRRAKRSGDTTRRARGSADSS